MDGVPGRVHQAEHPAAPPVPVVHPQALHAGQHLVGLEAVVGEPVDGLGISHGPSLGTGAVRARLAVGARIR